MRQTTGLLQMKAPAVRNREIVARCSVTRASAKSMMCDCPTGKSPGLKSLPGK
jgi:hypothetical protein